MKTKKKKKIHIIEKTQHSIKIKSMIINAMVFSILSFIAVLLITEIT